MKGSFSRLNPRRRTKCLTLTATVAALMISVRAPADINPVILDTEPMQKGKAFECRIPCRFVMR
jgi:hypothetical protein